MDGKAGYHVGNDARERFCAAPLVGSFVRKVLADTSLGGVVKARGWYGRQLGRLRGLWGLFWGFQRVRNAIVEPPVANGCEYLNEDTEFDGRSDVLRDGVALDKLRLEVVPADLLVGLVVAVEDLPVLAFNVAVARHPMAVWARSDAVPVAILICAVVADRHAKR